MTIAPETPATTDGIWQGPGIYTADQISLEQYHADIVPGGSLSSSGARKLLAPSCPAKFRYEQDNPPAPKKTFDFGHAAHKFALGDGPEIVVIDRPRWDTNEVKAQIAEARECGAIPLKPFEYERVQAMADALRRHPEAGPLLEPDSGTPEQSLYWIDKGTGITCRARLDWWRHDGEPCDYKSAVSAEPEKLRKHFFDYGYFQQDDWYCTGLEVLGYGDHVMRFIVQEKEPPYVVTVVRLDLEARRIGRLLNETARHLYAQCMETGYWPGYSDTTELISLPAWVEAQYH